MRKKVLLSALEDARMFANKTIVHEETLKDSIQRLVELHKRYRSSLSVPMLHFIVDNLLELANSTVCSSDDGEILTLICKDLYKAYNNSALDYAEETHWNFYTVHGEFFESVCNMKFFIGYWDNEIANRWKIGDFIVMIPEDNEHTEIIYQITSPITRFNDLDEIIHRVGSPFDVIPGISVLQSLVNSFDKDKEMGLFAVGIIPAELHECRKDTVFLDFPSTDKPVLKARASIAPFPINTARDMHNNELKDENTTCVK